MEQFLDALWLMPGHHFAALWGLLTFALSYGIALLADRVWP